MSDPVNLPSHCATYLIQLTEVARHLNFCLGNAFKYVLQSPFENGPEDLRKALKYLELEAGQYQITRYQHTLQQEFFLGFITSVGYTPGSPDSGVAFTVRTDVIPAPYGVSIVNFLLEMKIYLFSHYDVPENILNLMEGDIYDLIRIMERQLPF